MTKSHDKSISTKLEVIEILEPQYSKSHHRDWIESAIERLKKDFDTNEDLTVTEKLKIVNFVSSYALSQDKNPMNILAYVKQLPEHKAKIAMALLEKNKLIESFKSDKKDFAFK